MRTLLHFVLPIARFGVLSESLSRLPIARFGVPSIVVYWFFANFSMLLLTDAHVPTPMDRK
jgi:hypothetical protein